MPFAIVRPRGFWRSPIANFSMFFGILQIKFFLLCFLFLSLFSASTYADNQSRYVLVSVAPHKFFVEKIAGNTVKVGLMVPAGASAHTFEPSPKETLAASRADLWFQIGEGFEARASAVLKSYNPCLKLIDLRQNLSLIPYDSNHTCACHSDSFFDLHFWLSPKLAKIQAETIAQTLMETYPENRMEYLQRLQAFIKELDELDQRIRVILQKPHSSIILVSHPAYAYFCRDYGFTQLSIEFEGKDPSPKQLTSVLNQARNAHITKVFVQPQYSNKGARLIAKELNAEVITLDPYSENYMASMLQIAEAFAYQPVENIKTK